MSNATAQSILTLHPANSVVLDAHLNAGADDAICTVKLLQNGTQSYLAWLPKRSRLLDRLRMGQPTLAWLEGADGDWRESPVHAREVSWERLSDVERALLRQARVGWPAGWADEVVIEVVVPDDCSPIPADTRFRGHGPGGVPRT